MQDEILKFLEDQGKLRRSVAPFEEIAPLVKTAIYAAGLTNTSHSTIASMLESASQHSSMIRELELKSTLFSPSIEEQLKLAHPQYLEDLRRTTMLGTTASFFGQHEYIKELVNSRDALFSLPKLDDINRHAQKALAASTLFRSLTDSAICSTQLQAAMANMENAWLNTTHPERSARAFADIFALGEGLAKQPPFDPAFSTLLRPSLGDWRGCDNIASESLINPAQRVELYRQRGFDPALTDFTVPAFDESTKRAGLWLPETDKECGHCLNENEEGLSRTQQAYVKLQDFETQIRQFIVATMSAVFGENWMKRQLPDGMLQQWKDKRDRAIKSGQTQCELIEYADFSDYKLIIERRDNWNQVFKSIFMRREDICESFIRIHPVRIATMHSRIITLDDELLLLVETKRVLKAIKAR
ncbi:Swt1 family HEPN domain-containing protein [Solidesulfovibrio sp.]|uniref:Swt1 family HEPN domain-containing protein n=1 Tax=Solidesulfovibrio sp. TaxID=2910990 RepID=UPI002B1FF933|nr:Swt1 family HEPN domain-containing protein [Solidesulfovibrio sp.]MEA4856151.1 Swt1 family HEPN domain-containing protein [Solidesulfovibrio sp.]